MERKFDILQACGGGGEGISYCRLEVACGGRADRALSCGGGGGDLE